MRAIIAALALAGCATTESGYMPLMEAVQVTTMRDNVYTITFDQGGDMLTYANLIERFERDGTRVEIKGYAGSSATLFLYLDNVCVSRGAVLGFHGPITNGTREQTQEIIRLMGEMYPSGIREKFLADWSKLRIVTAKISGARAMELSPEIEECE